MRPLASIALRLAVAMLACLAVAPARGADKAPYSAQEIQPLLLGTEVPAVDVFAVDGTAVDLRKLIAKKPAVVIFYRGGW